MVTGALSPAEALSDGHDAIAVASGAHEPGWRASRKS